jgi:hypothetical protein
VSPAQQIPRSIFIYRLANLVVNQNPRGIILAKERHIVSLFFNRAIARMKDTAF